MIFSEIKSRKDIKNNDHNSRQIASATNDELSSSGHLLGSGSTLLPATFSPSGKPPTKFSNQNKGNACRNFLLGGTYYPGKDKKRRLMKRKTLWYRLFCSTWWRKSLSFVGIAYILFFHAVKPIASYVLENGHLIFPRRRRKGLYGTWLLVDESLIEKVNGIEAERVDAIQLRDTRHRLQAETSQAHKNRMNALERIVPGWFHRNDKNADKSEVVEEKLKEAERIMEQRQSSETAKNEPSKDDIKQHSADVKRIENADQRRLANSSSENSSIRTLHNMHLFHNQSSCPNHLPPADIRVTLIIQSTLDRLWILKRTCQRWTDPIILVLFVGKDEVISTQHKSFIQNPTCPQLKVIHHKVQPGANEDGAEKYPVNRLRNLGLDAVETSHILIVDVDFIPSRNLPALIRSTLAERNRFRDHFSTKNATLPSENKDALVVPAFERISPSELCKGPKCPADTMDDLMNLDLPESFEELQVCVLKDKKCRVFQSHNNWDGHSSTRSHEWLDKKWARDDNKVAKSSSSSDLSILNFYDPEHHAAKIRKLKCFDSVRYEPYVVLRWCPSSHSEIFPIAPYYDERFHGYGKNKIELISHLRVLGYSFSILPEGFIIHTPHSISRAKKAWESTKHSDLHSNMDHLYPKFLKELVSKYKHENYDVIKQCIQ